jgi:hypothetical protein
VITPGGLTSTNYDITFQNGTLAITPAALAIKADDKTKVYDGQTFSGFTVTYTGFVAGETVTNLGGSLSFTGTAVAAVNAGSSYVITPGGLTSTNYEITFQNGTLAITPAALAIKADDKTKVYDGQTFSGFTATFTGFVAGESAANLGGSLSFSGTAVDAINAGSYTIIPGGLTSDNYAISYENGALTIHKADPVVVAWPAAGNIVYGEALSASVLTGGEATGTGNTALTGIFSFENADMKPNAGTQSWGMVFTPSDVQNYNEVVAAAADFVAVMVAKFEAVITLTNLYSTYNGTQRPAGIAIAPENDLVTGEPLVWTYEISYKGVDGTVYGPSADAPVETGKYEVEVTLLMDNYKGTKTAEMQIDQGAPDVVWPVVEGSLIYGDKAGSLTLNGGSATYPDWHVDAGDPVQGEFVLDAPDFLPQAGVYQLKLWFVPVSESLARLSVTVDVAVAQKELTIGGAFTARNKFVDGNVSAELDDNNLVLEGVVEGDEDDVLLVHVKVEFADAAVHEDIVVSIVDASLDGSAAGNYTLSLEGAPTATASILAIPVYKLTLMADLADGGTVLGGGEYKEGETVTIAADVKSGFIFVNWKDQDDVVVSTLATFDFVMPAKEVTLTASFVTDNVSTNHLTPLTIMVYPNPAREEFTVSSGSMIESIRMFDLTGKLHLEHKGELNELRIRVGDMPVGIYILHIQTKDGLKTQRVQVSK